MGIEEVLTAYRSPWQNAYVERLNGSIRRECTDHIIVWNERHLKRILRGLNFLRMIICEGQGFIRTSNSGLNYYFARDRFESCPGRLKTSNMAPGNNEASSVLWCGDRTGGTTGRTGVVRIDLRC